MSKLIKKINNIEISEDKYASNGLSIVVVNPWTKQGVGMYMKFISSDDLRALADFIDEREKTINPHSA